MMEVRAAFGGTPPCNARRFGVPTFLGSPLVIGIDESFSRPASTLEVSTLAGCLHLAAGSRERPDQGVSSSGRIWRPGQRWSWWRCVPRHQAQRRWVGRHAAARHRIGSEFRGTHDCVRRRGLDHAEQQVGDREGKAEHYHCRPDGTRRNRCAGRPVFRRGRRHRRPPYAVQARQGFRAERLGQYQLRCPARDLRPHLGRLQLRRELLRSGLRRHTAIQHRVARPAGPFGRFTVGEPPSADHAPQSLRP